MPHVEQLLIREYHSSWQECQRTPECRLLHLAILREILRRSHSERSGLMATGSRKGAEGLQWLENTVDELRNKELKRVSLEDALKNAGAQPTVQRSLPPRLLQRLPKDFETRFDRKWERELVGEAARVGWNLWAMKTTVEIFSAETFHRTIEQRLWPQGIVLSVEPGEAPADSDDTENTLLWNGKWLILMAPQVRPQEFYSFENLAGRHRASPLVWDKLFSPADP